jgi:hypothetical protein
MYYEYHLAPSQSEQYSSLKRKLQQGYQETVITMISGKTVWALS